MKFSYCVVLYFHEELKKMIFTEQRHDLKNNNFGNHIALSHAFSFLSKMLKGNPNYIFLAPLLT